MTTETRKAPEGSLDWWMGLEGGPTPEERQERARLLLLLIDMWNQARQFDPVTKEIRGGGIQNGFPANQVCGNILDAAAELMSMDRGEAQRTVGTWAEYEPEEREQIVVRFFSSRWTR